jgi:hypothetical protein
MDLCTVGVDSLVMSRRTLLILALLVAGLELGAQTSTERSAPVGVLVGIHKVGGYHFTPGPPIPAALRTVWLDTEGSATPALPRLLVPRSSGFWWLGLTNTCSEQPHVRIDDTVAGVEIEISDALWASPTAVRPVPEAHGAAWNCRSADVFCGTNSGTSIYWVWPDFISMNRGGESGCGVHPDGTFGPEVHRLDDLKTLLTVGAVFGAPAEARLRSAYDRAKLEYRSRHRDDGCEDPDVFSPTAWHVERQAGGRWLLEGWADTHRLCEVGITYSAVVDFSRVTGSTAPQRPLSTSVSRMKDTVASAHGRWILLIGEDEVALSPRGAPDQPIAKAPLSIADSVVMVEWAYGRNVARWRDQVRKLADP